MTGPKTSQPVFVIAQQRSGTNLLRKSLSATPDFRDLDEVFHPEHKQYWHYRKGILRQQPARLIPTRNNQISMFESFLEKRLLSEQAFTLIDIKYNSIHALDPLWHSPLDVPLLIQWLVENQYPVIHLTRANHLENYVSMATGTESAKWIVRCNEKLPDRSLQLELDPETTLKQIQRRERELRRFRHYLKRTNCVEFEYENLLDTQGHFTDEVLQSLKDHLDLATLHAIQPFTRKMGRSISEVVVNFDTAIKPLLIQHGYGQLLRRSSPAANLTPSDAEPLATRKPNRVHKVFQTTVRDRIPQPVPQANPVWKPVFLITMQQYDTDGLRDALTRDGSLSDLNEVFHPAHKQFWPFRRQQIGRNAELSLPTASNQLEIFESFLNDHRKRSPTGVLIDIKYPSVHHLNHVWHPPGSRPLLLEWLVKNRHPVIHLVHDNLLPMSVSEVVRRHSRLRIGRTESPALPSSRLRVAEILRQINMHKQQESIFRSWLAPTHCLELQSETLAAAGALDEEVAQPLRNHLGITDIRPLLVSQKSRPPVGQGIENFESEIRPVLVAHGYEKWLPSARAA